MIIKLSDSLQYEVVSAQKVDGKIVAIREDGTEIVMGGDLSIVEVIGGELEMVAEPSQEERIAELEEALDLLLSGVTE